MNGEIEKYGNNYYLCIMKKFTESLSNIKKVKGETITYFDLFSLLRGLEPERPGIKDRIWKWMCDVGPLDSEFAPYNGRISYINLFYYGVGDEYELDYIKEYPEELEHCKKTHPDAFIDYMGPGKENKKVVDLRLDLNLILHVYQDEIGNGFGLGQSMESFPVMVCW